MVTSVLTPVPRSRLAVLSYHSWDTTPELITADIRLVRARGWRFVSASEATAFLAGGGTRIDSRIALVTTDDGHEKDTDFREALRRESCPGVTFVNVGLLTAARIEWYRRTHADDWCVQDHGALHRKQFVSGHLTGVYHGQKIGGLEYLSLPIGAPLLATAGQLASPRFEPNPEAIARAAEWAAEEGLPAIALDRWMPELSNRLIRARLAYVWRGRSYVTGTLETQQAFERRVAADVREGRAAFNKELGHAPTMFAYPWWQGSAVGDREFAAAGYVATFAGTNRVQVAGMSPYSIPRVVTDPAAPRPLDIGAVRERSRADWTSIRGQVQRVAKRMLGVI